MHCKCFTTQSSFSLFFSSESLFFFSLVFQHLFIHSQSFLASKGDERKKPFCCLPQTFLSLQKTSLKTYPFYFDTILCSLLISEWSKYFLKILRVVEILKSRVILDYLHNSRFFGAKFQLTLLGQFSRQKSVSGPILLLLSTGGKSRAASPLKAEFSLLCVSALQSTALLQQQRCLQQSARDSAQIPQFCVSGLSSEAYFQSC